MRPSGGHAVVLNWSMYNVYGVNKHEVHCTLSVNIHRSTSKRSKSTYKKDKFKNISCTKNIVKICCSSLNCIHSHYCNIYWLSRYQSSKTSL